MGKPIRILHVLGAFNHGGIEIWLLHLLRGIDRERFRLDFLVHTSVPGALDDEVRALGSTILACPNPSRPWSYARRLRRLLRQHGPYDVVHSHVHHFSGWVLRLAAKEGVPVRIAHSHLDTSVVDRRTSIPRRAYLGLMTRWLDRYATERLGCSDRAGAALFHAPAQDRPSWSMFPCGLNFEPFHEPIDQTSVRAEFGIPDGARVIGHVGRFHEQKNHRFLIEIMTEVARRDPKWRLLLVGDGPLRAEVERQVAERSLQDRVVFAGVRADVPRLLLGAMDVFVFPSLYEGLPLTAVEAQAAGLPCVLSENISQQTIVVAPLVRRVSLSQPPGVWAEAILSAQASDTVIDRVEARSAVERSHFNIRINLDHLQHIYETVPQGSPR